MSRENQIREEVRRKEGGERGEVVRNGHENNMVEKSEEKKRGGRERRMDGKSQGYLERQKRKVEDMEGSNKAQSG